jgi:hypothetical protein
VQTWKRYHKHECKWLSEVDKLGEQVLLATKDTSFRMLSQLLLLKYHGVINDAEWVAITKLNDRPYVCDPENLSLNPASEEDGRSVLNDRVPSGWIEDALEAVRARALINMVGLPSGDQDKNVRSLMNKVTYFIFCRQTDTRIADP